MREDKIKKKKNKTEQEEGYRPIQPLCSFVRFVKYPILGFC